MARFDIQKFAAMAAKDKILNMDVTLGQLVQSSAIGSLVAYDEPWELICGNDLRLFIWPGPRRFESLLDQAQIAQSVRDSLA